MSTCISRHGEYSEHEPNENYVCTLCGALDEDALIDERDTARTRVVELEARDEPAWSELLGRIGELEATVDRVRVELGRMSVARTHGIRLDTDAVIGTIRRALDGSDPHA